jgi:predicted RNA-binding protein associated with RNAse of E/G family
MLLPPDAGHTVWWLWDARGRFDAWYVNLEDPVVRWHEGAAAGVDGCDHDLDVWVYPDRNWAWKDEDELAERLEFPEHYWVDDHRAVWAEGEKVVQLVEAGHFPFDGTWCDLRPDPSWLPPVALPARWDRPRRRPASGVPAAPQGHASAQGRR